MFSGLKKIDERQSVQLVKTVITNNCHVILWFMHVYDSSFACIYSYGQLQAICTGQNMFCNCWLRQPIVFFSLSIFLSLGGTFTNQTTVTTTKLIKIAYLSQFFADRLLVRKHLVDTNTNLTHMMCYLYRFLITTRSFVNGPMGDLKLWLKFTLRQSFSFW